MNRRHDGHSHEDQHKVDKTRAATQAKLVGGYRHRPIRVIVVEKIRTRQFQESRSRRQFQHQNQEHNGIPVGATWILHRTDNNQQGTKK